MSVGGWRLGVSVQNGLIPSERALPVGVIILEDEVQALDPNPIRFAVCVVWRNVDPKTAVQQALVVFVETDHSPRPDAPHSSLPWLRSFSRTGG